MGKGCNRTTMKMRRKARREKVKSRLREQRAGKANPNRVRR